MHIVRLDFKFKGQRMQWTSIRNGCVQLYFRLDWACGRTCKVEKGHGPLHRPAFPRGNKSSCGRPGACQSKAILIMAKAEFRFWCEPAGKPLEMLQSCLIFARQELPLCGTCNYQPCAQQEGIMARIRWVPNACFKFICIQSVKETFCELLEWVGKNSDLAHLCWDVGGNAHPPCAKQADCLPELTSK